MCIRDRVLPWPYLACGKDGVIRHASKYFARLIGEEAAALPGKTLTKWFSADEGNGGLAHLLKHVTPGHAWHGRLSYQTGGDRLAVEVVIEQDPDDAKVLWLLALENPIINEQMVMSARSELRLLQLSLIHI